MQSVLEEIYHTDCGLREKMKFTAEYSRLKKEAEGYYDKLFGVLGEEPTKWLDEVWLLEAGMQSEFGLIGFREGIRFVFRLFADLFTDITGTEEQS